MGAKEGNQVPMSSHHLNMAFTQGGCRMLLWMFACSTFYSIKIKHYLSLLVRGPAPFPLPIFCLSFWKNLTYSSSIYSLTNSMARRVVSLKDKQTCNKTPLIRKWPALLTLRAAGVLNHPGKLAIYCSTEEEPLLFPWPGNSWWVFSIFPFSFSSLQKNKFLCCFVKG